MRRVFQAISALISIMLLTAMPAIGANSATVVSFGTEAQVAALGAAAPQYPKVFVENYNSTGAGLNLTLTSPCPSAAPPKVQVAVTGFSTGCYVQSSVPLSYGIVGPTPVQIGGDLGGTPTAPTVIGLSHLGTNALASVPPGAGVLPAANGGPGASIIEQFCGDAGDDGTKDYSTCMLAALAASPNHTAVKLLPGLTRVTSTFRDGVRAFIKWSVIGPVSAYDPENSYYRGSCPFTGLISGTTLTATVINGGKGGCVITPGQVAVVADGYSTGVTSNTAIVSQLTQTGGDTPGLRGTYQVSISQTVSSESMLFSDNWNSSFNQTVPLGLYQSKWVVLLDGTAFAGDLDTSSFGYADNISEISNIVFWAKPSTTVPFALYVRVGGTNIHDIWIKNVQRYGILSRSGVFGKFKNFGCDDAGYAWPTNPQLSASYTHGTAAAYDTGACFKQVGNLTPADYWTYNGSGLATTMEVGPEYAFVRAVTATTASGLRNLQVSGAIGLNLKGIGGYSGSLFDFAGFTSDAMYIENYDTFGLTPADPTPHPLYIQDSYCTLSRGNYYRSGANVITGTYNACTDLGLSSGMTGSPASNMVMSDGPTINNPTFTGTTTGTTTGNDVTTCTAFTPALTAGGGTATYSNQVARYCRTVNSLGQPITFIEARLDIATTSLTGTISLTLPVSSANITNLVQVIPVRPVSVNINPSSCVTAACVKTLYAQVSPGLNSLAFIAIDNAGDAVLDGAALGVGSSFIISGSYLSQ